MSFQPRHQDELLNLPDEKIIEYSVAARDAGDLDAFAAGIGAFVWARRSLVQALVARKISSREDRENVVQEVMLSVLRSSHTFRGSHTGELVNWLKTIIERRAGEYAKKQYRQRQHELSADATVEGEDGDWLPEIADLSDEQGAVLAAELVARILAPRSRVHQRAIELKMDGHPSIRISEMLAGDGGISPENVDQVFSRFRKEVKSELDRIDG